MFKRVGEYYHEHFKDLNELDYIQNYDGFNMSMININKNIYYFSIRILGDKKAYYSKDIIPGNYSSYKKNKLISKIGKNIYDKIDIGKNFFWGNWNNINLIDNTIIFIGKLNHTNLKISVLKKFKPLIIKNMYINIYNYKYSDIRFFKINNKIYIYDGFISYLLHIYIENSKIKYQIINNTILCREIRTYDKNWAYVDVNNKNLLFLNWFKNGYVTMSYINKQNFKCIEKNIIKMKGSIIEGNGTDTLPMFSFGTPLIKVKKNYWIGVGHTKIIHNKKYKNKKINNFIIDVKSENKKYIEHLSYYYLNYNIILKKKNKKYKMYISDNYLLKLINQKYIFSINFSLGINIYKKFVYITMGVGDFYNNIYKISLNKFLKSCIHDIEYFDETKYDYLLKIFEN